MPDASTQTSASRYGAQLRFHFKGLSSRMTSLVIVSAILNILNGCSYYLYWRPQYISTKSFGDDFGSLAAFHVTCGGVFFMFMMTQLVVQMAFRAMIDDMGFFEQQSRIKRSYLAFVISVIPVTAGQITLYSNGWYSSSHLYSAWFVATVYLNIIFGACAIGYSWASTCADWMQSGVRNAANKKIKVDSLKWEMHLHHMLTTVTKAQEYEQHTPQNGIEPTP